MRCRIAIKRFLERCRILKSTKIRHLAIDKENNRHRKISKRERGRTKNCYGGPADPEFKNFNNRPLDSDSASTRGGGRGKERKGYAPI